MAALASDPRSLRDALQLAFCHLMFNVTGILLFYPLPFLRIPVFLARGLGNTTVKYRWFCIFYLLSMFFALPITVFALSYAGSVVFAVVSFSVAILVILTLLVNYTQVKKPHWLPMKYRTWDWLPLWMHSLDPLDRLITRTASRCLCCRCLQDESRRDASVLGIRANQSQLHILEAAKPLAGCPSEAHMCAFEHSDSTTWSVAAAQQELSPTHVVSSGHLAVAPAISGGMTMKALAESTPL